MISPKQIPHLLKLLDDDSSDIRDEVIKQLCAFGPTLRQELKHIPFSLNSEQTRLINLVFEGQKRILLAHHWPRWFTVNKESEKLETALKMLSEFLTPIEREADLTMLLDKLAYDYQRSMKDYGPLSLAKFLFKMKKFKGNQDDYYNPQNSNLIYVITEKKGIPISLACVYMLVGMRLGIRVEGCHFPGHFLARVKTAGRTVFVDCFNSGQVIDKEDILSIKENDKELIREVLGRTTDAETIVRRFLANLIRTYQMRDEKNNCELMIDLFNRLDERLMKRKFSQISPDDIIAGNSTNFALGEVVVHKQYGYRGIIVDTNTNCQATDDWYYGNHTQPEREQPWYHVLVDGSDQVTYVAQSNLEEDLSTEAITHPLLTYFFKVLENGHYLRNDNPWPDSDF